VSADIPLPGKAVVIADGNTRYALRDLSTSKRSEELGDCFSRSTTEEGLEFEREV
jgi:hypothetical protein